MYVEIWDFGQHSTLFEFLFLGAHLFIATIDGNLIVANALYVPNIVLSPCIVKLWWNMQIWKLVLFPIDIIYGHVVSFYFFYDNAHRPDLFFEVCWCCQSFSLVQCSCSQWRSPWWTLLRFHTACTLRSVVCLDLVDLSSFLMAMFPCTGCFSYVCSTILIVIQHC